MVGGGGGGSVYIILYMCLVLVLYGAYRIMWRYVVVHCVCVCVQSVEDSIGAGVYACMRECVCMYVCTCKCMRQVNNLRKGK